MSLARRNLTPQRQIARRPIIVQPTGPPTNPQLQPSNNDGPSSTHQILTPTTQPTDILPISRRDILTDDNNDTTNTNGTNLQTPFGTINMNIQAGESGIRNYSTISFLWSGLGKGKINLKINKYTSLSENGSQANWFKLETPLDVTNIKALGAPFYGAKRSDTYLIDIYIKRPDGKYFPLQPGTPWTTAFRTFSAVQSGMENPPRPGISQNQDLYGSGNRLGGGFLTPLNVGNSLNERMFINKNIDISDLQKPIPRRSTILDRFQKPIILILFFAIVSSVILKLYKEPEDADIKEYFKLKRHENRMRNAKARAQKDKRVAEADKSNAEIKLIRAEKKQSDVQEVSNVIDNELKKTLKAEKPKTSKELLEKIETRQKLDKVIKGESPDLQGTFKLGKIKIGEGAIKGGASVIQTGVKEGIGVVKDVTRATADLLGTVVKAGPAVAVPIIKEGSELIKKPVELVSKEIISAPRKITEGIKKDIGAVSNTILEPARALIKERQLKKEGQRARKLKQIPERKILQTIKTEQLPRERTIKTEQLPRERTIKTEQLPRERTTKTEQLPRERTIKANDEDEVDDDEIDEEDDIEDPKATSRKEEDDDDEDYEEIDEEEKRRRLRILRGQKLEIGMTKEQIKGLRERRANIDRKREKSIKDIKTRKRINAEIMRLKRLPITTVEPKTKISRQPTTVEFTDDEENEILKRRQPKLLEKQKDTIEFIPSEEDTFLNDVTEEELDEEFSIDSPTEQQFEKIELEDIKDKIGSKDIDKIIEELEKLDAQKDVIKEDLPIRKPIPQKVEQLISDPEKPKGKETTEDKIKRLHKESELRQLDRKERQWLQRHNASIGEKKKKERKIKNANRFEELEKRTLEYLKNNETPQIDDAERQFISNFTNKNENRTSFIKRLKKQIEDEERELLEIELEDEERELLEKQKRRKERRKERKKKNKKKNKKNKKKKQIEEEELIEIELEDEERELLEDEERELLEDEERELLEKQKRRKERKKKNKKKNKKNKKKNDDFTPLLGN
jgi:hypothetical protein